MEASIARIRTRLGRGVLRHQLLARYLNQIRSLKEKVNTLESSLASMQIGTQKNEERLTQKVLDLSKRVLETKGEREKKV